VCQQLWWDEVRERPAPWSNPGVDDGEQSLRTMVVAEFLALDGVMQAPGGAALTRPCRRTHDAADPHARTRNHKRRHS